jgi:hypothetical protein
MSCRRSCTCTGVVCVLSFLFVYPYSLSECHITPAVSRALQDYTIVTHNATNNVTTVDSGHYQVRDPYTPSEHFLPYNRYERCSPVTLCRVDAEILPCPVFAPLRQPRW